MRRLLLPLPVLALVLLIPSVPAFAQKRGLARLEGRWVSASTSPNVDDWVCTFGARGRYAEHTPGGGDVDGRYALVSARGDTMTIRVTIRIRRAEPDVRAHARVSRMSRPAAGAVRKGLTAAAVAAWMRRCSRST
jgi:hypothetical protein